MSNATSLPTYTNNKFFFWNAKLTNSLDNSATAQTVYWDTIPVDENGTTITGSFLIAVRNTRRNPNRTELMWVPASAVSADGLSATTVVRGLKPSGLDYTAGDTDFIYEFDSGDEVFCAILPQVGELLRSAVQGIIGTGANNFKAGDGTDSTIKYFAYNADASKPWIGYDSATNQWLISNDGTSSFVPGTGAGAITGGDGISVTAGDIDVDTTDTTVFKGTSAGAGDENKVPKLNASGKLDTSFITAGPLATYISDVTATAAQLNSLASGAFSTTFYAGEAVTADQAVAQLPIEVEHFAQLTDANLALGDSNARRKHAIKFIPSVTTSSLTTMQFRAAEAVNGATALGDLTISICADSAGAPGSAIANGTANVITQTTQRTWNTTQASRTATWATPPTLTAGTTYWLVFGVAATNGTNYLNISVNSSHDENYITFTRLTYDLDTTTWGTSTTNATPFFWFNTQVKLLGTAIVPADASWGARTWNFIGFAVANISAGASGSVYYNMVPDLAGLVPGADYYLSETAGEITTTAPGAVYNGATAPTSFAYKIGRAINTTTLQIKTGTKRVVIIESLSTTTTRQYLLWFRPEYMRVSATGTGSNDSAISSGYITPNGTNGNVYMDYVNSAAGTAGTSTSDSLQTQGDGTDKFTGVTSNPTDIGFTYTYTEGGTANMYSFIEATA